MRLLKLEIKRVLKTRITIVLLFLSFLFSFLFAYLPTTFSYINHVDGAGQAVKLKGLDSIRYEKEVQADITGAVTPEKIRQALEDYQACLTKYGVDNTYDLPDGVYERELFPFMPLLHGVREAFADPGTGIAPSLMELSPEDMDHFYEKCDERCLTLMKQEQKDHPAAHSVASAMYQKVGKPFLFFPGYGSNPMEIGRAHV